MLGGRHGLGVEENPIPKIERQDQEQGRILGHILLKSSRENAPHLNLRRDHPRKRSPMNEAASEKDPEPLKDPVPELGKCEQNPVLSRRRNRQHPGLPRRRKRRYENQVTSGPKLRRNPVLDPRRNEQNPVLNPRRKGRNRVLSRRRSGQNPVHHQKSVPKAGKDHQHDRDPVAGHRRCDESPVHDQQVNAIKRKNPVPGNIQNAVVLSGRKVIDLPQRKAKRAKRVVTANEGRLLRQTSGLTKRRRS